MRASVLFLTVLIGVTSPPSWAGEWPQFRGLNGGVSDEQRLPSEWAADKNIVWKVKVPGYGWSSPVVWGDKIFVTTAVADNQRPPERKGPGGGNPTPLDELMRWKVLCLDRATGETLWSRIAVERKPTLGNHISNTYASETPVTDGERVYAYFGMAGWLGCFDLTGELLWQHEIGPYRVFGSWGTSISPVLDGERLFVQCDNEERSFVAAFDCQTGRELWCVSRSEKSTWGTPVVWHNHLRTELVCMGARRIRSYEPASGRVLWELATTEVSGPGRSAPESGLGSGTNQPGAGPARSAGGKAAAGGCKSTPVATRELIFVGMAPRERGQSLGPMWAVKAEASGDISLKPRETSNAHIAWFRPNAGPHFASGVVHQDRLYVFAPHGGELRCFDAKSGADIYQQRLPRAGDFKSSPWVCGGKLFGLDENGSTFVIEAGPEFKLLGVNRLDELCWATPAVAHESIFIRTVECLYCLRAPP